MSRNTKTYIAEHARRLEWEIDALKTKECIAEYARCLAREICSVTVLAQVELTNIRGSASVHRIARWRQCVYDLCKSYLSEMQRVNHDADVPLEKLNTETLPIKVQEDRPSVHR